MKRLLFKVLQFVLGQVLEQEVAAPLALTLSAHNVAGTVFCAVNAGGLMWGEKGTFLP